MLPFESTAHRVPVGEVADLVTGAAEGRKYLAGLVIENADLFGASAHHEHILLLRIA